MARRLVVIASGETERRALPHLLRPLLQAGRQLIGVRIPPGNRPLNQQTVFSLIVAEWWQSKGTADQPDKFVVLLDADGRTPLTIIEAIKNPLEARLKSVAAAVKYAVAQRHLEAWYFADEQRLRHKLGRALGRVDASQPDEILNPKHHLRQLLDDAVYTARVSEDIARALDPAVIKSRSSSFAGFVDAAQNGNQ